MKATNLIALAAAGIVAAATTAEPAALLVRTAPVS